VIRLALRVRREDAEIVLAELLPLTPSGVEEVELDEHTIEYAIYGAPGELPGLPDLQAVVGGALVQIATSEVADDWNERWKDFHRPVTIPAPPTREDRPRTPSILLRPPWEPASDPAAQLLEIVIDPGQAFGTGGHASTRLCLDLLLELHADGWPSGAVLDVGTGSGVLAIAAGLLGYGPLLGLDNEIESVQASEANATVNDVDMQAARFDLRRDALPWLATEATAPPVGTMLVFANLLRPLLLLLAEAIERPPARLIAGGLLVAELDEIAGAFSRRHGMRELARREGEGWGALLLALPDTL
jgi:ribosomal protein L11 methyltransferase